MPDGTTCPCIHLDICAHAHWFPLGASVWKRSVQYWHLQICPNYWHIMHIPSLNMRRPRGLLTLFSAPVRSRDSAIQECGRRPSPSGERLCIMEIHRHTPFLAECRGAFIIIHMQSEGMTVICMEIWVIVWDDGSIAPQLMPFKWFYFFVVPLKSIYTTGVSIIFCLVLFFSGVDVCFRFPSWGCWMGPRRLLSVWSNLFPH